MTAIADLHIHSRFSRATSRLLTPRHLAGWAMCKGINVLGTGDFTHPQWREELREQLAYDERSGLYALNLPPETPDFLGEDGVPGARPPLFCLQAEISSIYRRGGRVRKVHNLVFVPTLEDADALSRRLSAIGNLASDGRPILGLDSHDLLEMVLETSPEAVLIPAHVWTPWFSLFGSKSGFDEIGECFGDLTEHVFALETGLSSDPEMNRMVSALDGFALISNSDAHSGANLGREANLFEGDVSYRGMFAALRAAAARRPQDDLACRFLGTMEFYPEEGKYHLDGHRACGVALDPRETRDLGGICPVCGRPLTIGVLHRVLELADRDAAPDDLPLEPEAHPLIPLPELVAEILGVGASSRRVAERHARLLRELGPDLDILRRMPVEDIRARWEPLGEAVARMRRGQVIRRGGYDGEYGVIRVFAPEERGDLLEHPRTARKPATAAGRRRPAAAGEPDSRQEPEEKVDLSADQLAALSAGPGPALVLAGPGAGKTRVLVGRMARLLREGIPPHDLMALTFTRRAAGEMRGRAAAACSGAIPPCDTLHGHAAALLRRSLPDCILLPEDASLRLFEEANPGTENVRALWDALLLLRERMAGQEDIPSDVAAAAARYADLKDARKGRAGESSPPRADFADLLDWMLIFLTGRDAAAPGLPGALRRDALESEVARPHPAHVLVDEIQDLSPVQTAILAALLPEDGSGLFGIGDPDQAIYGFRGAGAQGEEDFRRIWPDLSVTRLNVSWRAGQPILDMARSLLGGRGACGPLTAAHAPETALHLFRATDERAEARWIARRAAALLGAASHTLLDASHGAATPLDGSLAPGDIAVLVRLRTQMPVILRALEEAGVPCAAPEADPFWRDPPCAAVLERAAALLADGADNIPPPDILAERLAGEAGPDAIPPRRDAWKRLSELWGEAGSWTETLARAALLRDEDEVRARAEHVQVMTLHASKGLEFQAVFLPGLEDGLLPFRRNALGLGEGDVGADPDEERRLLYVGITRAARGVFAGRCERRRLYGRELELAPSPFLPSIESLCRRTALVARTRMTGKTGSLLE